MKKEAFVCCICGLLSPGFGNNPDGAMWRTESGEIVTPTFNKDDRCCDDCNANYVIPGRIYQIYKQDLEAKKND